METAAAVVVVVAVVVAAVPPKPNEQPRPNVPLLVSTHNPLLYRLLLNHILRLTVILISPTLRTYHLIMMTMTVLRYNTATTWNRLVT